VKMRIQFKPGDRPQMSLAQFTGSEAWTYGIVRKSWSDGVPDDTYANRIVLKHPKHGVINFDDKEPISMREGAIETIKPGDKLEIEF
jgi:hypothetical protein